MDEIRIRGATARCKQKKFPGNIKSVTKDPRPGPKSIQ
jgi:hypothetical protein